MPRPSATDLNDTSTDPLQQQQRSQTPATSNASIVLTSDIPNSNSSPDYRSQTSLTPTRLVQQTSLSSTLSDEMSPNILSLSTQEQTNDTTTSSFNSIPISRNNPIEPNIVKDTTTPNVSPPSSPLHSTPKPTMEDKFIQCIDNDSGQRQIELVTTEDEQLLNSTNNMALICETGFLFVRRFTGEQTTRRRRPVDRSCEQVVFPPSRFTILMNGPFAVSFVTCFRKRVFSLSPMIAKEICRQNSSVSKAIWL
jgi:hypothetical protein